MGAVTSGRLKAGIEKGRHFTVKNRLLFAFIGDDFVVTVISSVGNYGEIFERHVGTETAIGLERGLNAQWTQGGLIYSPPHPCACYIETKLTGLNALTASRASQSDLSIPQEQRLEPGPAFSAKVPGPARGAGSDWPTYRADNARSGHNKVSVGDALKPAWSTKIGGTSSSISTSSPISFRMSRKSR